MMVLEWRAGDWTSAMAEIDIVSALVGQAPGIAGVIAVVLLFLRSMEKRDQLFVDQMSKVTERLAALENLMTEHDTSSRARGDTMKRIERKLNLATKKGKR